MASSSALAVRNEFPALLADPDAIYADGATGTQVHESVPASMFAYMSAPQANICCSTTSGATPTRQVRDARVAAAALLNCEPEEVTFGPNMTSLTFHLSHSVTVSDRVASPDGNRKNVVVSRLCHDANVSPWVAMAERVGAEVRWVGFDPGRNCAVDLDGFGASLDADTVFVGVGYASNACGIVNPAKEMIREVRAKSPRALVFVDAVHYAPHGLLDVRDLDCDFLACSPYKFFGPHMGILYGRAQLMGRELKPFKVSAATDDLPGPPRPNQQQRWEMGTLNTEGTAGVLACIKYIADLGVRFGGGSKDASLRSQLTCGFKAIGVHERRLAQAFLDGIRGTQGLRLYGPQGPYGRTPTFALRADSFATANGFHKSLKRKGVVSGAGNFYARYFSEDLGLESTGGYLRVAFVHYNTEEEAKRVAEKVVEAVKEGEGGAGAK